MVALPAILVGNLKESTPLGLNGHCSELPLPLQAAGVVGEAVRSDESAVTHVLAEHASCGDGHVVERVLVAAVLARDGLVYIPRRMLR